MGLDSPVTKKTRAIQTVIKLRDSRGARAQQINIKQGEETEEFWNEIGGKGEIKQGDDDSVFDEQTVCYFSKIFHEIFKIIVTLPYLFSHNNNINIINKINKNRKNNELERYD